MSKPGTSVIPKNRSRLVVAVAAATAVGMLTAHVASAATTAWNVASGDDGLNTNWNPQTVPGSSDTAIINNGGNAQISGSENFTVTEIDAGSAAAGNGSLSQSGGILNITNGLYIGKSGSTGLFDLSGGTVTKTNATSTNDEVNLIGSTTTETAVMKVRGTGVFNFNSGTGNPNFQVGVGGKAHLYLMDNAQLNLNYNPTGGLGGELWVGGAGGTGTFDMSGGTLNATAFISIGRAGTGVANFSGGTVNMTRNGAATSFFVIGGSGGSGTANVSSNAVLNLHSPLAIGNNSANSVGAMTISGGTINIDQQFFIGRQGNSAIALSSTLTQSGGVINKTDTASLTFNGATNIYNLSAGTLNNTAGAPTNLGESTGTTAQNSTWTISGTGVANIGVLTIASNSNASNTGANNATLNLNGGTLSTTQIVKGSNSNVTNGSVNGTINFNGGLLQAAAGANSNFLSFTNTATSNLTANILAGGAKIDTNGNNITIGQKLITGATPDGGMTKFGTGTLTLSGPNTFNGPTTINAGTLAAGVASLTNNGAFGKNSAVTLANIAGATLDTTGFDNAIGSLTGGGSSGGNVVLGSNRLTLGGDGTNPAPYAGVISGAGSITKLGLGTQTFSGANTYTGNTAINAGVLNVTGSLAGTATVNSTGTLKGVGNNATTGIVAGSVTVNGGGTIATAGLSSQAFDVNGLTLGNAAGYDSANFATVNLSATGASLAPINVGTAVSPTGLLTLNSSGAYVPVASIVTPGVYTLMNYGSQTGAGGFSLSPTTAGVTSLAVGRTNYSLADGANSLVLTVSGAATPGVAFFNAGAGSFIWNDTSNPTSVNFSSNLAGTTDAGNVPAATTDVILTASNQTGAVTTTLGANTTINSLNVNTSATSNTIAADGSTLTINALADSNTSSDATYTGNAAGNGIMLASGAGPLTINAPIILGGSGNSQTWINNSSSPLTVNGNINGTGGAQTLSLKTTGSGNNVVNGVIADGAGGVLSLNVNNSGSGVTTLTGANSYTGTTTVAAGTLQLGDGTIGHDGISTVAVPIFVDNGSIVFNRASDTVFAGQISGAGSVTVTGNNKLTMIGANTFTGTTTINPGATLQYGDGTTGHGASQNTSAIINNGTLNFAAFASVNIIGPISGTGPVNQLGPGTEVFFGNNTYTGVTTISGGTLKLGDGTTGHDGHITGASIVDNAALVFNRFGTDTYDGIISGTGGVTASTGVQILTNANTYSGLTQISGAGTLQLGNGGTTGTINTAGTITDNGVLAINRSNAVSQGVDFSSSPISGTGGVTQLGTGTTTLNLANPYTGNTTTSNGVLNITGSTNSAATAALGRVTVANVAGDNAVTTLNGGTINALQTATPGLQVGTVAGAAGSFQLNSGLLNTTSEAWAGTGTGSWGAITLNGGTAAIGSWLAAGRNGGNGIININGGSITVATNNITAGSLGSGPAQVGVINFNGGTTSVTAGGIYVGENNATGIATVSGSASVTAGAAPGIRVANANTASVGILNLNGGTVTTPSLSGGAGTSVVNFNGGKLVASADSAGFIGGITTAQLQSGGAIIDDGGHNITVGQAFVSPTGSGVTSIPVTTAGTGYIDTPIVQVTGGTVAPGGAPATAVANINYSTGQVTGITITSPGNYTSTAGLGVSFTGGGVTAVAPVVGTVASAANLTGGLIKIGAGTLTYSGASTYSGNTTVSAGTLKLAHTVYNNSVHASDIAAYWKFNDAANLFKDYTVHGNDLQDINAGFAQFSTNTPANHTGSVALTNNTADYFTSLTVDGSAPANFPLGNSSYTLSGWINLDGSNTGNNGIIGYGTYGTTKSINAMRTTGTTALQNFWWNSDLNATLPNSASFVNNWHYVTATYDNVSDLRTVWLDGVAIGSDTPGVNNSNATNFTVGKINASVFFSGNISDLFVANSAISQADIVSAMNNGITFGTFSGTDGALSPNSLLTVAATGTVDLDGTNQIVAGLGDVSGAGGSVTNSFAGASTLTLAPTGSAKTFSGVISDGAGTVALTQTTGSQILAGVNTYSGDTNVNGGTLTVAPAGAISGSVNVNVANGGTLAANGTTNAGLSTSTVLTDNGVATIAAATSGVSSVTVASVTLGTTGSLSMTNSGNHANRKVLVTGALNFAGSSGAWGGKLDLQSNDLIIHNGNLGNVTNQIKQAFNNGTFTGAAGITTTSPAADTLHTLGSASGLVGTYDGVGVVGTDVFVKYTYYGDADLNGVVNGNDYSQIDFAFTHPNTLSGWQNGDFNYDNKIDGSDYSLIDNAFNRQSGSLAASASMVASSASEVASPAAVPEPTSLGLFGLGAVSLLGRRRRKAK